VWIDTLFSFLIPAFSTIAQTDQFGEMKFFVSSNVDPGFVLRIIGVLLFFIILIIVVTLHYQKWKRYNDFVSEMKTLDLDPESEGTLAAMVKRYQMDEPVNILFSARLFDEMATTEIMRVLGSPAPASAKQQFIDQVYNIRLRTYHPEWTPSTEESSDEVLAGAAKPGSQSLDDF
jgi:hypothetical protein